MFGEIGNQMLELIFVANNFGNGNRGKNKMLIGFGE